MYLTFIISDFLIIILLIFNTIVFAIDKELKLVTTSGNEVLSKKINPDKGFAIRYTHSVAKSPVTDYFIVEDNKIFLDKTIYKDFGAGLPHCPEGSQIMRLENGSLVISGFKRYLPEFILRVGRVAEHTLLIPDIKEGGWECPQEIILSSVAYPGTPLRFIISDGK